MKFSRSARRLVTADESFNGEKRKLFRDNKCRGRTEERRQIKSERLRGNSESVEEKRMVRQMRFNRENQARKGRISIVATTRYRVVNHESRPLRPERRICHDGANGQKSEAALEIKEDWM